jgi:hypothetical protein
MKNEKCSVSLGFNIWLLNYLRLETNIISVTDLSSFLYLILLRVPGLWFPLYSTWDSSQWAARLLVFLH